VPVDDVNKVYRERNATSRTLTLGQTANINSRHVDDDGWKVIRWKRDDEEERRNEDWRECVM
jgi:hypothetical protein